MYLCDWISEVGYTIFRVKFLYIHYCMENNPGFWAGFGGFVISFVRMLRIFWGFLEPYLEDFGEILDCFSSSFFLGDF